MSDFDPSVVEEENPHISSVFVLNNKASKFAQHHIQSYNKASNLLSENKPAPLSYNDPNSKSMKALRKYSGYKPPNGLKANASLDNLFKRMTKYHEAYALKLEDARYCMNKSELKECSFIPLVNRSFSGPRTINQFYIDQLQHIENTNTHRCLLKTKLDVEEQKKYAYSPAICKNSTKIFKSVCKERNVSLRLSKTKNNISNNYIDPDPDYNFTPSINIKSAKLHRTHTL
jgi:hypothetical protein